MIEKELIGMLALANSSRSVNDRDLDFVECLAKLYASACQRIRKEYAALQLAYHDPLTTLPQQGIIL